MLMDSLLQFQVAKAPGGVPATVCLHITNHHNLPLATTVYSILSTPNEQLPPLHAQVYKLQTEATELHAQVDELQAQSKRQVNELAISERTTDAADEQIGIQ